MQMTRNKTTIAIALFLVLTFAVSLVALPVANAHSPAWEIPTFAFIYAAPNPVGVGQPVFIVVWLDKMIDGGVAGNDIRFHDFKLTITKPDETTETVTWDVVWDTVSSAYIQYTPEQTGTYKLKFEFPGQEYTWSGNYQGDTYLASSATTTLTVQEEPLPNPPTYPLPTEYWTRPIEGQNTEWYQVASNWLGTFEYWNPGHNFQPDGVAPNTPHIMWTKPLQSGGVVGGGLAEGVTYYSGLSYEGKFINPIIMNGRLYYDLPRANDFAGSGYVCVDLRTGETIYWQNMTQPVFGQLYDYESPNQHGVIPSGYLWAMSGSWSTAGTWKAYDSIDGSWLFSITNVPAGTLAYGPQGEVLLYQLAYDETAESWRLLLWNNTAAPGLLGGKIGTSGGWQWRPNGKTGDGTTAYSWNGTIPALPGTGSPTIFKVLPGDVIIGKSTSDPPFGTSNPYTLWAISDKPETRGNLLWIKNYSIADEGISWRIGWAAVVSETARVIAINEKETMRYWGISIDTGEVVWGPTAPESSLDYYQKLGVNEVCPAYGNLYTASYGGILRCYSMTNGTLLWSYNNTASGLATPWPNYPLGIAAIADGKVYTFTSEHSPNAPLYKGARLRAINATTGKEMWTMLSWMSGFQAASSACAIADGYLTYLNCYDNQIYCIGKGPSATAVSIQDDVITHGDSILVKGSVVDIAAGTEQDEQAARFPNGVPAVSDESMSAWMEYVYMQKPKPSDVTGVEVVISVLDPNNNFYEVGRTTSDADGFYKLAFEPLVPGEYTVIATFEGSASYYGSHAVTAINVEEAPPATAEPTPEPEGIADAYFVPAIAGIIVAIIVVGIVMMLMLRKR